MKSGNIYLYESNVKDSPVRENGMFVHLLSCYFVLEYVYIIDCIRLNISFCDSCICQRMCDLFPVFSEH